MKRFFILLVIISLFNIKDSLAEDFRDDFNKFEKKIYKSLDKNSNVLLDQPWWVMNNFGHNYSEGIEGFPKDFERSLYWYQKASDLGLPLASFNLAMINYSGKFGLNQNFEEAHKFFILAFEQRFIELNTRFFVDEKTLKKYLDDNLPEPSKEFSNLRDLFISALELPSKTRYERLKNLVDLQNIKTDKFSIQDFISNGEATCDPSGTINKSEDRWDEFKITILAQENNILIIRKAEIVGELMHEDLFTREDKLLSLKYAKNNNSNIEWFDYVDQKLFGQHDNYFIYFKLYVDDNQKLKLYKQPYYIKSNKDFNLKMNQKFKIKSEELLGDFGSQKHIDLEDEFYHELYNNYSNIMKDTNNGASLTEEFLCEI